MNETFEKIDFSQTENSKKIEKISNFSFYEFTKNPLRCEGSNDEEINFFEKFHINFNINNLIFNPKQVELDMHSMENIDNIENKENFERLDTEMHGNEENSASGKFLMKNDKKFIDCTDSKRGIIDYDKAAGQPVLNEDREDNFKREDYASLQLNSGIQQSRGLFTEYEPILSNISTRYNPSHEDFNNMENCGLDDNFNYGASMDYSSSPTIPRTEQKYSNSLYLQRNNQIEEKPAQVNKKDMDNLSDKFNLFAFKRNNSNNSSEIKYKGVGSDLSKIAQGKEVSLSNNSNNSNNRNNISQREYAHNNPINESNISHNSLNNINIPSHQNNSHKKILTKEYFSKQINSIGNLNLQSASQQVPEIIKIENKFGISEGGYECPDYNSYSEEKLKEEMKKFGYKAGSVKFMVKTLIQVWEFMNMKKLPENLRSDLSKFMNVNKPSMNQDSSGNLFNEYNSTGNASIRHLNDVKKEKIVSSIQEDELLWIKILRFKKVELKEIKEVLNKKGIIVENEILKSFLTGLGVVINQAR